MLYFIPFIRFAMKTILKIWSFLCLISNASLRLFIRSIFLSSQIVSDPKVKPVFYLLILLFSYSGTANGQNLHGSVQDGGAADKGSPLVGASVFWAGTTLGTTTDANGKFAISKPADAHILVISFVGYTSDSIHVHSIKKDL